MLQFFQKLNLALNLASPIGVISKPIDKHLNMLPILELGIILPLLILLVFEFSFEEVLVIAPIGLDLLRLQVKDLLGDLVQEAAVVAHNQKRTLPSLR